MARINSAQFEEICTGVWNDRSEVLSGRGLLTGEAALLRAVYWRLFKVGVRPADGPENHSFEQTSAMYQLVVGCMLELNSKPTFDGSANLRELLKRYEAEASVMENVESVGLRQSA